MKIFLQLLLVFIENVSINAQALVLLLTLVILYILQYKNQPYSTKELNAVEQANLLSLVLTTYFGLYYLTVGLHPYIKLAMFILVFVANLYFFLLLAKGILREIGISL